MENKMFNEKINNMLFDVNPKTRRMGYAIAFTTDISYQQICYLHNLAYSDPDFDIFSQFLHMCLVYINKHKTKNDIYYKVQEFILDTYNNPMEIVNKRKCGSIDGGCYDDHAILYSIISPLAVYDDEEFQFKMINANIKYVKYLMQNFNTEAFRTVSEMYEYLCYNDKYKEVIYLHNNIINDVHKQRIDNFYSEDVVYRLRYVVNHIVSSFYIDTDKQFFNYIKSNITTDTIQEYIKLINLFCNLPIFNQETINNHVTHDSIRRFFDEDVRRLVRLIAYNNEYKLGFETDKIKLFSDRYYEIMKNFRNESVIINTLDDDKNLSKVPKTDSGFIRYFEDDYVEVSKCLDNLLV